MTSRMVDLFCGCGGLSLGFMAAGSWKSLKPVLAIDSDLSAVKTYNRNLGQLAGHGSIAVECDISDFIHPTEVRTFYLDRLTIVEADRGLARKLDSLGVGKLKAKLHAIDSLHLADLKALLHGKKLKDAYAKLGERERRSSVLRRFLARFRLPPPGVPPSG